MPQYLQMGLPIPPCQETPIGTGDIRGPLGFRAPWTEDLIESYGQGVGKITAGAWSKHLAGPIIYKFQQ